jgi:hypothetical protein
MIATYRFEQRPWTVNGERRGSTHWSTTREQTRIWRHAFWALGLREGIRFPGPVTLEVRVVMRHPLADTGACIGAVKAAVDGLVDARVLTGDTGNVVRSILLHAPQRATKTEPEYLSLTITSCGSP